MFLKIYLTTIPVFIVLDMVWIRLIAKSFYEKNLGYLIKSNVNIVAVVLFYLLYVLGLTVFVIYPAFIDKSYFKAVWLGALLGLIAYSTYDLTNLATIKNWPLLITIVDLVWGMSLSAVASLIGYLLAVKLLN